MLSQVVSSRWFALADLLLVIGGGALWIFKPEIGVLLIIAIVLIPWVVRILAGSVPFRGTLFDWLVALFLVTAWVGYWAAYDKETAWNKVWLIVLTVLLYYALSTQPAENLEWVCALLFCVGLGVSIYFFLTHDFVTFPRKVEFVNCIGHWIMSITPRMGWTPIHPNYVAGIAAITTPFILYPARKLVKRINLFTSFLLIVSVVGLSIALFAILMATSRGVIMAIASAVGIWLMWRIVELNGNRLRLRREAVFPPLVLIYLCAVILFLYAGPANSGSVILDGTYYGTSSRGELAARSLYLLSDFPFTGGGLGAFPGLYSHYMLEIPIFYLPNSHNLFLDVAIEQGLFGGFSVFIIFLVSIWFAAQTIAREDSPQTRRFAWLTLFALVIAFVHGMVDDYLYNGSGTFLLLSLTGISIILKPSVVHVYQSRKLLIPSIVALMLIGILMPNLNNIRSIWNANLGAVQMSKVELAGFPTNQWTEPSILPKLEQAESSLHTALQTDPTNRTANHRLGLIALLRGDFLSSSAYLEKAHQEAPNHRGIIKALGYCYVWLGEMEKAQFLLSKIPEASSELDVYVWWWEEHGQPELSQEAIDFSSKLNH